MAVQDVTVVSIPVSDQERAKAFYVDTLGLGLVRDDDSMPGIRWIQVAPKAGTTSLTLVTWFESMAPGSLPGQRRISSPRHAATSRTVRNLDQDARVCASAAWGRRL